MHRANPRTSQDRNRQLRRHPHVNCNAIALLNSQPLQRIRKPLHLCVQLAETQPPHLARLTLPQNRRLFPAPAGDMPIHAVVTKVDFAAHKPLRPRQIPLQNLRPRPKPVQLPRSFGPKSLGIRHRPLIHPLVLRQAVDVRALRKLLGRRKHPVLAQNRL